MRRLMRQGAGLCSIGATALLATMPCFALGARPEPSAAVDAARHAPPIALGANPADEQQGQPCGGDAALGVTLYDGPYIGLRVSTVQPKSPAATAGLRAGDRILSINGVSVADSGEIIAFIAHSRPGDVVEMRINRKGSETSLTAILGERDAVFGRRLPPVRYRGPADDPQRFYQPPPPGEIGD